MARYFAAPADLRVLLDFDKRSDLGFVPNLATVKVDELGKFDALSELDIGGDGQEFIHNAESLRRRRGSLENSLQLDQPTALANGVLGRLEHLHHPQPGQTVVDRLFAVLNAVEEIVHLYL